MSGRTLNEKIYKKHILYMPITEMIWYIPMSLLAFEAYIGSPALIKQSQFPYYENYYTVQGKVVSFERNGSDHTYRSILVLDNGNTYYIPPTLERNYGYEDWLLNKIHSDITSGKEVILQVLDFDNSDYTPAIMSLKCNGVEYFSLEESINIYQESERGGVKWDFQSQCLGYIPIILSGTCAVLQVLLLERKARVIRKNKKGLFKCFIWMHSGFLVAILLSAYVLFGIAWNTQQTCLEIFDVPSESGCETLDGSVISISKIDDDNYLQVEMGGKTAYLLLKNVQEHFSVEDITHIATGEKLNLLVYNFPYSGKIVSGILKISSDNKTYISYSEGKNLYYIAMSKTPKE